MPTTANRIGLALVVLLLAACSTAGPSTPAPTAPDAPTGVPVTDAPATQAPGPSISLPADRLLLFDTDVAGDDLVALAFLVASPNVTLAGITVSGTGEAHCAGGVDVILRLLERLDAPAIPVACGRETPLEGAHEFPLEWRERVDAGSGLELPATDRTPATSTAVELIEQLSKEHADLVVLATGPLTNLADALLTDPELAERLGPVFIMGGALHVPGNLVCCGAPQDNHVAEWNIYVDPKAAQVVVDSGLMPSFVPLDGTNQVPITPEFARRAIESAGSKAQMVLADLFEANPFMTQGEFYLWDALAAEVAAGYPVGSFSPARIQVEVAEGPESGFTRPVEGDANIQFLSSADADSAHATLLAVLDGG